MISGLLNFLTVVGLLIACVIAVAVLVFLIFITIAGIFKLFDVIKDDDSGGR